jgi:hypothetical protein
MADEFEVVCGDALVKFFDADRGHVHESLLFGGKGIADDDSTRTGRIKAATRTAAEPATIAAMNRAPEKPAA